MTKWSSPGLAVQSSWSSGAIVLGRRQGWWIRRRQHLGWCRRRSISLSHHLVAICWFFWSWFPQSVPFEFKNENGRWVDSALSKGQVISLARKGVAAKFQQIFKNLSPVYDAIRATRVQSSNVSSFLQIWQHNTHFLSIYLGRESIFDCLKSPTDKLAVTRLWAFRHSS